MYRADDSGATASPDAGVRIFSFFIQGHSTSRETIFLVLKFWATLIHGISPSRGSADSEILQLEMTGEIGSGPRASDSAFWIDAYSVYLGCTNPGPNDCSITVKGYQNSSAFSYITQGFTQPPCPEMKNCSLAFVELADGFRNLTGLQIIATVEFTPVDWYMDNLSLGWSNNSCAAQLDRSSQE